MKRLILLFMLVSITALAIEQEQIYGPVKAGELLWNIAGAVRPDPNLDRYRVMMALLTINSDAFKISCNINSLQVGKILRVPTLTEIQTLTSAQALALFEQQKIAWQKHRQSGQPIVCSEKVVIDVPPQKLLDTGISEPNKWIDNQVTTVSTTSFKQVTPMVAVVNDATALSVDEKPISETIDTIVSDISPSSKNNVQDNFFSVTMTDLITLVNQPLITIPISIIVFALSLFCLPLFLILRLVFSIINRSPNTKKLARGQRNEKTEPTIQPTESQISHLRDLSPIQSENRISDVQPTDESKEKLAVVRSYLAEGEEVTLHRLLQDVIKKGSAEQQAEARQLIEINRKMQPLRQGLASHSSQSNNWIEIIHTNQHLFDQQYAPENQSRIFEVVDKIFSLLDNELDAKGQLMEAYHHRYKQPPFEANDYQVVNEEGTVNQSQKSRDKTTRYL